MLYKKKRDIFNALYWSQYSYKCAAKPHEALQVIVRCFSVNTFFKVYIYSVCGICGTQLACLKDLQCTQCLKKNSTFCNKSII